MPRIIPDLFRYVQLNWNFLNLFMKNQIWEILEIADSPFAMSGFYSVRSCRNCDLIEQFMVLYHVKEIINKIGDFLIRKFMHTESEICTIMANSCNYFFLSSMVLQIFQERPPTLSFNLSFILNIFFQSKHELKWRISRIKRIVHGTSKYQG